MYHPRVSAFIHEAYLACKRNIVATVNLDCRLDLKTIALHARNAEYNPKVLADSRIATILSSLANLASVLPLSSCVSVSPKPLH